MPSQPTNVRIVTNDRDVRSGTTKAASPDLRLSGVTLTSDDLDRLAAAIADRLAPVAPSAESTIGATIRRLTGS